MKKIIGVAIVVLVLAGCGYWYWETARAGSQVSLHTEEVKYGRLKATIGSTGTLQPQDLVDVGAQVVGRIVYIGPDSTTHSGYVDWGSKVYGPTVAKLDPALAVSILGGLTNRGLGVQWPVLDKNFIKPGTILAKIDEDLYKAQEASTEGAVKAAEWAEKAAEADLLQKTATLAQATADWGRAQALFNNKGIAQAEYDLYQANFNVAQANLATSKANIENTKAQINTAKANLKTAETNLNYTTITSPVDGVVIDRRVNVGQTVVASLSAPSLFLIAKDLTKLEVWATVNEVDVGKIKAGQDVDFTVDAFPGKVYHGKVVPQGKFPYRFNATMNQNVVTYTVVVSVNNKDNVLSPYLTTNLSFIVEDKKDALLVPNAALRWQPSKEQIAPDVRDAYSKLKGKKHAPTDTDAQDHGFVWIKGADDLVRYVEVHTGLSDTVNTEILNVVSGGDLPEHTAVVVGEGKAGSNGDSGANPFAPQIFKPKPKE